MRGTVIRPVLSGATILDAPLGAGPNESSVHADAPSNVTGTLPWLYTLIVTGNVQVVQGKTVINGPKLKVDLKTKRTVMTGGGAGGRVKGRFVPK